MIATPEAIKAIYFAFSRLFQSFMGEVSDDYSLFTSVNPVTTPKGFAIWLSSNVKMRKWLGERTVDTMALRYMEYGVDTFQATIGLKRQWVEDDAIGAFAPALQQFAQQVSFWQAEQVWELVAQLTQVICWNGNPFFYASHPVNPDDASLGTYRNYQTNFPLSPENYDTARTEFSMFKGEDGRYMRTKATHLIVPPTLESTAKKIIKAENYMEVKDLGGGIKGFIPNTNTNKDTAVILSVPDLVTDSDSEQDWLMVDSSKPLKPLGFGLRRAIELTAVDQPTSENVFFRDEYVYGADARGGTFVTDPRLMYKCTGATP